MRIISKYIAKDLVMGIGSIAAILLLIVLGKLLIQLLAEVLDGDLGVDMLGTVLLLGIIRYLVVLLPFSFFIAIVSVLSRMYRDSEATAAMAGGATTGQFIRSVAIVGVPLVIILYLLVAYISPWASRLSEVIENVTEQGLIFSQLAPGKFVELEHAGWVIYAESENKTTKELHNVFVQRADGDTISVEIADRAWVTHDNNNNQIFVLQDGQRLVGKPGQGNYKVSTYDEHRVYPPRTDFSKEASKAKYQPIDNLLGSDSSTYRAEFLQRASIVISTIILMLWAVPLSKVSQSSSRFTRLAVCVAIYVLYLNLVLISCSWIKRGEEYGVTVLFAVHIMAAIAAVLAYRIESFRLRV